MAGIKINLATWDKEQWWNGSIEMSEDKIQFSKYGQTKLHMHKHVHAYNMVQATMSH